MKAILATAHGAALREVPTPEPGEGEILVKVDYAGLNRADLNTLKAADDKPIGMEWCGTVAETGPGVVGYHVGDRVMCAGKHGFAEYAVADCGRTMHVPEGMDMRSAGASMLALQTAHNAI